MNVPVRFFSLAAAALIVALISLGSIAGARADDRGLPTWPPVRFDHAFHGSMVVRKVSSSEAMAECGADACQHFGNGGVCIIIMTADRSPQMVQATIRHERGHCNGWGTNHAGARSPYDGRPITVMPMGPPDRFTTN